MPMSGQDLMGEMLGDWPTKIRHLVPFLDRKIQDLPLKPSWATHKIIGDSVAEIPTEVTPYHWGISSSSPNAVTWRMQHPCKTT